MAQSVNRKKFGWSSHVLGNPFTIGRKESENYSHTPYFFYSIRLVRTGKGEKEVTC